MAAKHLLHKSRLSEFLKWCQDEKGLAVRNGQGDWQLAQIQPKGSKSWHVIYERIHMPEHVTVPDPLVPLVLNFIRSTK